MSSIIGVVLGLIGTGLGLFNSWQNRKWARVSREIEANGWLDQAVDILPGQFSRIDQEWKPGKERREIVCRLVRDAKKIAPKLGRVHLLEGHLWRTETDLSGYEVPEVNYRKAEKSYREAIRRDPTCAEAYGNLGEVLDELGDEQDWEEATASYGKATQLDYTLAVHRKWSVQSIRKQGDPGGRTPGRCFQVTDRSALRESTTKDGDKEAKT